MPPRTIRPERQQPDLSNIIFRDDKQRTMYLNLYKRSVVPTKYVDINCLQTLGLTESVSWLLNNTGLYNLCTQPNPTFEPLVLEFLSSFSYSTDIEDPYTTGTASFRMFNREYTLDQEQIAEALGFSQGDGIYYKPFEAEDDIPAWEEQGLQFWEEISGEAANGWRLLYASHVHNPAIRYFHRILAHTIFGRTYNHKVTQNELFFLYCALTGSRVNAAPFMLSHFQLCAQTAGNNPFLFGGIITAIAYSLGLADEILTIAQHLMPAQFLDEVYCRDSHLILPRQGENRFTLLVNKVLVPSIILPCPHLINVQNRSRWLFNLIAPEAENNAPVDEMEEEMNNNQQNHLTMETLYQTMQQMQNQQNATFALVQQMHNNYNTLNANVIDLGVSMHSLHLRLDEFVPPQRQDERRPRTRGRGSRPHRND